MESPSQAVRTVGSGFLLRFFLPPVSVLVMGTVLALFLSQIQFDTAETAPSPAQPKKEAGLAPLFTSEVLAWEEKILRWSERYQLDPNLVATVMQIESCGWQDARSSAGAAGLFQVMPYHFSPGEDPFHPGTNARRGLSYLRQALETGGSVRLALAGYNGGIQGAQQPETQWPAETKRYLYWGMGIYRDARSGESDSPRLEEWLASGGRYLCQQAQ